MSNPLLSNPFADDRLPGASDYDTSLDVPSVNQSVSESLLQVIHRASQNKAPEARRKIAVLKGPAGYGKTHLMGRIGRHCHDAVFVFVPQVEEHGSPIKHIHWHVVEQLFHSSDGKAPLLHNVLARLCHSSFRRYFEFLPHTVKEQHKEVRLRLDSDQKAVAEIVAVSKEPAPFLLLADSIKNRLPSLPVEVVRALVLGWSPYATEARRWLRGEDLEEAQRAILKLPDEPPTTTRLLQTLAALLHRVHMSLVICCDQSEGLLRRPEAAKDLSASLISWLDTIPNLVLAVSCLKDQWPKFEASAFSSFPQRAHEYELLELTGPEAVELVRRRLATWPNRRPENPFWPFKEQSILQAASKKPLSARGLLKLCSLAIENWMAKRNTKEGDGEISIDGTSEKRPVEDLFRQEWARTLDGVAQEKLSPDDLQEERLFRAVRESMEVLRLARTPIGGLELLQIQDGALASAKNTKRFSLQLKLGAKTSSAALGVVVALTKLKGGQQMGGFVNSLEEAVADPIAGAVLVRPTPDLTLGAKTGARISYEKLKAEGKMRPFALTDHRGTFEKLETLVRLLDKAAQRDLQLDQQTIDSEQCRKLAVKAQVLAGLDLFETIFCGWAQFAAPQKKDETPIHAGTTVSKTKSPVPVKESPKVLPVPVGISASPLATSSVAVARQPAENTAWAGDLLRDVAAKLTEFGQRVEALGTEIGPTFARLKLRPLGKTSVGKVRNHANDLRAHISSMTTVPIISEQPGFISVDVQRPDRKGVFLSECLKDAPRDGHGQPLFPVGKDVSGKTHWLNLADPSTCHLLAAGTTGSGKSEFLKSLLAGLAARLSHTELKFVLADPKRVTFNIPSSGSPYLLYNVAHTVEEVMFLVQEIFAETERRYELLEKRGLEHVGELTGKDALPRIVVVFDEFADLMADRASKRELEGTLKRIGALARAAGIHLVLATQRPDRDVVTPLLKANLPTRICLRVDGEKNSIIILDEEGGERLLGRGDLFWKHGGGMVRLQGAVTTKAEFEKALRIGG
jgi:DNA segregation ATPase FtsK/SpoIIIE-like protein